MSAVQSVTLGGLLVGPGHPCRIIAEVGVNHQADLPTACILIDAAKVAGCDFVKFQKRTPELAVPASEWHEVRDTPWGKLTKIEYRRRMEFDADQYAQIDQYCRRVGIPWFASVWDTPSLGIMEKLGSPCHKIPSARLHDKDLLREAALTATPLILSTGMSSLQDVEGAVNTVHCASDGIPDLILLQCTSAYPARAVDSHLRVMQTYQREFRCPVGFSSHKIGVLSCVLAVAAGANLIERHITLSRKMKGSDHRMSTEPLELKRLVREIREAETILGDGVKRIEQSELAEAKRLRATGGNAR